MIQILIKAGAIIGLLAKSHLNGVSLAGQMMACHGMLAW